MNRKTVALLFVLGASVGIPLAVAYATLQKGEDRYFHAFVMLAALGVSFPAVSVFLTITLRMWDMAQDQRSLLKEMRDDVKPITADAKEVIGGVRELIEDFKKQDPKRIVDFIDKLSKDGTLERIADSVEKVGEKVHEAIKKIEAKSIDKMVDGL